ncbi:NADPH-dependent FMN reductase [Streptomyces albipurpureus]|uniref:NAD(P)H-dependent oxidoreductase n=1 Tax=Streptomyces albipurpureus TaxID=2897419 RepID=A0ABT0UKI7_9ACTN|nr:NAD(P)H-dependent oxidoreductase [Streptomyces sp. CWNU-1]MCM2388539.1 NAD(P)H-dependent oxidoreductase [Streptomyces sp. CWNU-1]
MDLITREDAQVSTPLKTPLKLVVILASNREGRFGPVISDWFLEQTVQRLDFSVELIDLRAADLGTHLGANPAPEVGAALAEITPKLDEADSFVVITPEYNHSFPASIKSLIDWHFSEWRGKPVGFVSYGGMSGGLRAVEQLRLVFAEMHAVTIRNTVSFHNAQAHFTDEGRHKDPAACDAAATAMLDQLAWWAQTLKDAKVGRPYVG